MGTFSRGLMRRLEANTKDRDLNLLVIGAFLTLILVLTTSSAVFAQSPWGLFQKLCPSGLLATGPQCANLFTGNNMGICDNAFLVSIGVCTPSSTNTCPTNTVLQNGVCVPISSTCPIGSVLQNGVCVPISSTCPIGSVLQNGVCVPISSTCPIGTVLQNGVCVPFTNPVQSAPVANAGTPQTATSGTTVFLDGTGSYATTSGARIVSYSWIQAPGSIAVTLSGANTATPSFRAPPVVNQTPLLFSLTVTDSLGQVSTPNSVTITVFPPP
jgi:hypothetical protein